MTRQGVYCFFFWLFGRTKGSKKPRSIHVIRGVFGAYPGVGGVIRCVFTTLPTRRARRRAVGPWMGSPSLRHEQECSMISAGRGPATQSMPAALHRPEMVLGNHWRYARRCATQDRRGRARQNRLGALTAFRRDPRKTHCRWREIPISKHGQRCCHGSSCYILQCINPFDRICSNPLMQALLNTARCPRQMIFLRCCAIYRIAMRPMSSAWRCFRASAFRSWAASARCCSISSGFPTPAGTGCRRSLGSPCCCSGPRGFGCR